MLLNYLAGDREPDSQTAVQFITVFFKMEEAVENSRSNLRVDPDSVINHRKQKSAIFIPDLDFDLTSRRAELDYRGER